MDATRYDLDRLGRAVQALVAQQKLLVDENATLRRSVQTRDDEIRDLRAALESAGKRRERAIERVDALIDEIGRLDGLLDESIAAWRVAAEEPASTDESTAPTAG